MRYLITLLLFVCSNAFSWEYEFDSFSTSNWGTSSGWGTCHATYNSKPCISNGSYFSGDGVGSGDVVFSYTYANIYDVFYISDLPSGFDSSKKHYFSFDAMTGPRNDEQYNKTEALGVTILYKNSSAIVLQEDSWSESINNTSFDTFVYEMNFPSGTYYVQIIISGRDNGYWNGNYGAVISAGSVLMSDSDPTSASPTTSTTTGTSGGITSAQSANKSSARTRSNNQSDNTVYIDQVGDNNTVTIEQDGTATNTIRGIYSSGDDAGLIQGDSNTIEIRQGADTSTSSNLIEFKIIGNSNDVLLYQDRLNTGYEDSQAGGGHNIILDVNGSSNDIDIIQRNNYDTYGGHYVDLEVTGSTNGIDLKQISDYSKDIFGKVTGSNNSVTVYQHDDSNKYLDFDLTGNGHTLDVEQTGTGAHNAEITLINGSAPSTVNLLQQGSTDQSYSLEQTCYTTGGCTVDVTQGN